MNRYFFITVFLGAILIICSGCYTINKFKRSGGDSKTVTFRTSPPGADIWYKNTHIGKTPCNFYVDLDNVDGLETVLITKDGEYYGFLQLTQALYRDELEGPLLVMFDLAFLFPFAIDVVCFIPVSIFKAFQFDSYSERIIYDGRCISLDKLKSGLPPEGYLRLISPYADLYYELENKHIFYGWDTEGNCLYKTQEQVIAEAQYNYARQQAMAQAVINASNSISAAVQQNTPQYQPPRPVSRPTATVPVRRTTTSHTNRSSYKPNTKRWCSRTYRDGRIHGEWDSRFSAGCPACRGTINW